MSLRIAIHSDLREHGDQAQVYRENLELFTLADQLGFDSAWVRSYHFRKKVAGFSFPGGLPSPFPFLAAVAARTSGIRLGTGVVPLPLENPIRVAEDAAVLDALSSGRFELGVSNGGQPLIAQALGVDLALDRETRKSDYLRSLELVANALDGNPLNGTDQRINPFSPGLSNRIWESALTELTGTESALRGNGVLIGTTQTVPAEITAAAYHSALKPGAVPRVGLVVHLHVNRSREAALAALEEDLESVYAWGRDWLPLASTLEEKAAAINVHYGTPAQIAESLLSFPAIVFATELQISVAYGSNSHDQRVDAVHAVVEDIAPRLGWSPAGSVPSSIRASSISASSINASSINEGVLL
jgi:alkanesulfonate monooxygenase SsuD/methylene tetrahydromethanopterin reductase-like flavin-dependent oxidoreductase (luciferase family)